jgi:hypothetical protein
LSVEPDKIRKWFQVSGVFFGPKSLVLLLI